MLSVIPVPKQLIKEQTQYFTVLYRMGHDKVKRLAIISTKEIGGLKILDIQSMISTHRVNVQI